MRKTIIEKETNSPFFVYTVKPREVSYNNNLKKNIDHLYTLKNSYEIIVFIIGGSCHNSNEEYDKLCKKIRLSIPSCRDEKILVVNIDGDKDHYNPTNTKNTTFTHIQIFLSFSDTCPFNIELLKFIKESYEKDTKIFIINSVFEYYGNRNCGIKEIVSIFDRLDKNKVEIINYVSFPNKSLSKNECGFILSNLLKNYKKEFIYWKAIYKLLYNVNYKDHINLKSNNLKEITFDTYLMYVFNLFFK